MRRRSRRRAPQPRRRTAPDGPVATFRSSTRLIVQTVTVKDKDGKPIEGLTAKDFIVTEDGEPQEIAFVEYQRLRRRGAQTIGRAHRRQIRGPAAVPRHRPRRSPVAPAQLAAARRPATSGTATAGCSSSTST